MNNEFETGYEEGEFELLEQGDHDVVLVGVANVGTVKDSYLGVPKVMRKIALMFELINKVRDDGKPYTFTEEYTFSFAPKATFRKHLQYWRGVEYTEDEAKKIDVSKMVGQRGTLEIFHKKTQAGKMRARLDRIKPANKQTNTANPTIVPFLLSYREFNQEQFAQFPSFIQDKMKTSEEWAKMMEGGLTNIPAPQENVHYQQNAPVQQPQQPAVTQQQPMYNQNQGMNQAVPAPAPGSVAQNGDDFAPKDDLPF